MQMQWNHSNESAGISSDPVLATLEGLLRDEEALRNSSRYAEALRAAVQARREWNQSVAGELQTAIAPYRLRRAKEYLEENLCNDIRLDDVAAAAGLSAFHFCRQFKQATGFSPLRYVLERRVERAKKLMIDSEYPLVDISLQLGFSSQSHFTAIFRKLTGFTPRRYRELCRQ